MFARLCWLNPSTVSLAKVFCSQTAIPPTTFCFRKQSLYQEGHVPKTLVTLALVASLLWALALAHGLISTEAQASADGRPGLSYAIYKHRSLQHRKRQKTFFLFF